MRVAFVAPGDFETTSGGFRYDRRLVASLRETDDVSVYSVPWRRYPLSLFDAPATPLSRFSTDADVVVVDELAHPTFAVRCAGVREDHTPVVALVHHLRCDERGPGAPLAREFERRFLARVDAAVCTSSATDAAVRDLAPDPALPTLVAPPTADQFDPDVSPTAVDARATESPFRVVFVGSLVPRKRPLALVDALAALEVPWEATFVGPQPNERYASRVGRRCRRRGVDGRVTLAGALPTAALETVLRRAHVLVLPSRHEGFGIAALEGMGFGLPAVVTQSGGATDLVTHGENGFLVPPDGVGAVYAALSALATDRTRLARMGRAALTRYRSHPPWPETAARTRTFLARVASDPSSAAEPPLEAT
ncbi:glycosyltransferase family 4 protein [Salinigranum halophilum]|uniref:glycosyltransferase family 4 protein n=1 Tax=Salinigranum halophilum TaxID=2565931 RepID=UPI0010A7CD2E|nr:glycosyltransferase family 4 protein [Salinigranum halophilum]